MSAGGPNVSRSVFYLEDIQSLVRMGCQEADCKHDHTKLIIVARCHPPEPVLAVVEVDKGYIEFVCQKCKAEVARIAISRRIPNSTWRDEDIEDFRKLYKEAVEKGQETFEYHGTEMLINYAKYLLQHVDHLHGKSGKKRKASRE